MKFQPLTEWLKHEAKDSVLDGTDFEAFLSLLLNAYLKVVISNRLVKSPCAIVADAEGYTANVARIMSEAR